MTLIIWSSGKLDALQKVFAPIFKTFRPNVPAHKLLSFTELIDVPTPAVGEVLVACGGKPLSALQQAGIAPKGRGIDSMRGRPIALKGGGHYLCTYDPYVVLNDFSKRDLIDWDIRLSHRLLSTGSLEPLVGDYQWVSDFSVMIAEIEAQFEKTGRPVRVSFDSETMGLYPWYPNKDFVCCSFSHRPGVSRMLYFGKRTWPCRILPGALDQVKWLLTSPKIRMRMANGKYDLLWVKEKWGIDCTNFSFDTLLAGSLINENRTNSLNLHAKIFTPIGGYDDRFNDKYDKDKMAYVPPEDLRVYQGGDTDACLRAADVILDELASDPKLCDFYNIVVHPAARAFEKVERRGVLVDRQKFAVLRTDLKKVIARSQQTMLDLLPGRIAMKHKDKIADQLKLGKNPLTPTILSEFFFSPVGLNLKPQQMTPTGKISLTKPHLRSVAMDRPEAAGFLAAMTESDNASKTLSTFVDGFLKHLRPDGRFHPSYMLFHGGFADDEDDEAGTVTGRLSAKEPAFQTIPKKVFWAKRLRECYPAPLGKVMVSIDYSQGELKVVACVCPEPTMLQAYLDGLDLHAVTGARLAQVPLVEFLKWKGNSDKELAELFDKHRGNAKPANFGLLYGMQVNGFIAYSWAQYGIKLTFDEGAKIRNDFFDLYKELPAYHKRQTNLVGRHREVRSPLGRVRHLPDILAPEQDVRAKAERQAINSPIQSTLADMMCWAIALIEAELGDKFETVGNVHDALIGYVDADKVQAVVPQVMEIMSNLPFHKLGWKPQLKFTVDAECGPDMAHLEKFKLLAA